jgi:hypothetical protein
MLRIVMGVGIQFHQGQVFSLDTGIIYERVVPQGHLLPVTHNIGLGHVGHLLHPGDIYLLG